MYMPAYLYGLSSSPGWRQSAFRVVLSWKLTGQTKLPTFSTSTKSKSQRQGGQLGQHHRVQMAFAAGVDLHCGQPGSPRLVGVSIEEANVLNHAKAQAARNVSRVLRMQSGLARAGRGHDVDAEHVRMIQQPAVAGGYHVWRRGCSRRPAPASGSCAAAHNRSPSRGYATSMLSI